jgi:hypothetical protein
MIQACRAGDLDAARQLHALGVLLYSDPDGFEVEQPIHAACEGGHLEVVEWLHSEGAQLHVYQDDVGTPMHIACVAGFLEIVRFLHAHGASLYAKDQCSLLPIHSACRSGHLDIVQWLIAQQVPIDQGDGAGGERQPIHDACCGGQIEVARWLHERGASLTCVASSQQPIHFACLGGHVRMVQWLYARGAPLDPDPANKDTPFRNAFQMRRTEVLEWLSAHGATRGVSVDEFVTAYRRDLSAGMSASERSQWRAYLLPIVEQATNAASAALLYEEEAAARPRRKAKSKQRRRQSQPQQEESTGSSEHLGGQLGAALTEAASLLELERPTESRDFDGSSQADAFAHEADAAAAKAPIEEANASGEGLAAGCVVCWDSPTSHVFIPCGHLCACSQCAGAIMASEKPVCPMCRTEAQQSVRVFQVHR